ncbi:glutamyl-tRNA reductase [Halobacteriaceae archaeon SHR40]|uniref:glutamyl-tRNA reductase n=1 Tax=Halovenus amylolytica TaxID=2500550 RepID=UPI000FE3DF7B
MYDRIAGLRVALETAGFERFEAACEHDEKTIRERLLGRDDVEEALVIRTCQRYEVYASGSGARSALSTTAAELGIGMADDERTLVGEAAVEHLFRLACGLESAVLGEDEILGQFRDAHSRASESGALDGTLGLVVRRAIRAGKRARTETVINDGRVSLGSVTVDRVRQELASRPDAPDTLADCSLLLVGAGEVAEIVVSAVASRHPAVSLTVANRTLGPAEELAGRVGGEAIELDELSEAAFTRADVLVSATGADRRVVTATDLAGHELVAVDLANPRDVAVEVEDLPGIKLVRIDEVLSTREDGLARRRGAIPAVEEIIAAEIERLDERTRIAQVDDAIGDLYARAHTIREEELERARNRLAESEDELTAQQAAAIEDFSTALVNKLLHPETETLREAAAAGDEVTVEAWLDLFSRATNAAVPEPETTDEDGGGSERIEQGSR